MPYTFAAAATTAANIREASDFLEVPICVENVSSYAEFHASEMTEWEFLSEVVEQADCGILLDVNNIYVSSQNHNFDPYDYLNNVPHHRVGQIHIAGHSKFEKYILDTHDHPVLDPVWKTVCPRHQTRRKNGDPARVGRSHPELRRSSRGGAKGEPVCRKTIPNRDALKESANVLSRRSMIAESDQAGKRQDRSAGRRHS